MTGKEIVDKWYEEVYQKFFFKDEYDELIDAIDAALAAEREAVLVRKDDEGWWISLAADGKRASFNVGKPGPLVESVLVAIRDRRAP